MVDGSGRGSEVRKDVVISVSLLELRARDQVEPTHGALARSRKMWTLNDDGDRSPEEVRWLWKIELNEPFSV